MHTGYFGASTGAASALRAAAELGPGNIKAVVSRGGRPDLATRYLNKVKSPTLLLVGERDHEVLKLNKQSLRKLKCQKQLQVIAEATHLFEEPGTMAEVTGIGANWFLKYLYRIPRGIEKDFME
ncbi:MAG: dienelactone hydrolase family protein [Balneolaceae bacterium]|nr:dienelactone hydrolase family protein [Balneolaceae bacterium]